MNRYFLLTAFIFSNSVINAQSADPLLLLTITTNNCHNAKPSTIKLLAKESVLKKFLQKEVVNLHNCNYLLQSTDDILKKAKPAGDEKIPPGDGNKIIVTDAGELLELYKLEKGAKVTGDICINSHGDISFSIGTEQGSIEISSSGGFTLSSKSPSGFTHKVEF